jgi:hypothetical protein
MSLSLMGARPDIMGTVFIMFFSKPGIIKLAIELYMYV